MAITRYAMGKKQTHHLRVDPAILEQIIWVCRVTKRKAADYTRPILQDVVAADYERYRPAIEAMKAAEAKAAEITEAGAGAPDATKKTRRRSGQ